MAGTLNLTAALEALIADICRRMDEFRHVDTSRLLVCISSTRGGGVHGTYAKIHPLRFPGGVTTSRVRRRGRVWTCTMPSVVHRETEMLYLIYFLAPRFFDLPQREKLITVFHELYHISPACDGDIRRFPGRNYAHGSSTKAYNRKMGELVDSYLQLLPDHGIIAFLDGDMDTIRSRHATIVGRRMTAPRISMTRP